MLLARALAALVAAAAVAPEQALAPPPAAPSPAAAPAAPSPAGTTPPAAPAAAPAPQAVPAPAPTEPTEPEPPPEPPPPEPPALPGDVLYSADRVTYDARARVVRLDGHVVIVRGEGRTYAARGALDRQAGTLRLDGGVLAIEGREVMLADAAIVDLRTNLADLAAATVYLKDRTAASQLQALTDRGAARGAGKNALVLHGKSIQRLEGGALLAREVSLTPCDCATAPDYEVLSPSVEIKDDRARLLHPSLRLFGLPIPIEVPISVPLTERQSGLLAPRFGYAMTSGFGIVEPVFLTLGRSWDVTIAPGWFTGSKGAPAPLAPLLVPWAPPALEASHPNFAAEPLNRTVRGPRLELELRGAPVPGSSGRIELDLVRDLDADRSVASQADALGTPGNAAGRGLGGFRGILRAQERTETGFGTFALDGTLASDAMIVADAQPFVIERFLDALRTDAGAWGRAGPAVVGAEATLLQDVRLPNAYYPDRRLFGDEARRTFQRLPSLFLHLPATPALGPLFIAGEASIARFVPLHGTDPMERQTGFGPTDQLAVTPVAQTGDALGLSRASATRLDAAPRLEATLAQGAVGAISAQLGGRADAWLFDSAPERDRRRLYGFAGLRAQSELSRDFGALRHSIAPSAELRAFTPALRGGGPPVGDPSDVGGSAFMANPEASQQGVAYGIPVAEGSTVRGPGVPAARRPYDELDGAAPEGGAAQAVLRVDQALWSSGGQGRAATRLLELTLAQDVLLWSGSRTRAGEAWAAAAARVGPLSFSARAQYDWASSALTGFSANLTLSDARGDSVRAGAVAFRALPSELIRGGVDELFSTARLSRDPGILQGNAGAGAVLKLPFERLPLVVAYGLDRHLGDLPVGFPDTVHHVSASVDTTCRCAGLQLALDLPFASGALQSPSVRFVLDLKSLGTFGSP